MDQWLAIKAVLEAVAENPEVRAVFLKGSLASGSGDQYSDVDLYCLVDECELPLFLPKRIELLQSFRPLVYTSEANFVGPQIVAVFDNGLHFDLYTVTLSQFPLVGKFKILYDPEGLLEPLVHKTTDHGTTISSVTTNFSEFSFTLLEFLAAWRRQDLVWSYRLASHLVGDLGMVLRHNYDPANALLGLKRLEQVLPLEVRSSLREATSLCHGNTLVQGVALLCSIMESEARKLELQGACELSWPLFNLMCSEIFTLQHQPSK